jgi:hypothetical protein
MPVLTGVLTAAQILEILLAEAAQIQQQITTAVSTGVDISTSQLDTMGATLASDIAKLKTDSGG